MPRRARIALLAAAGCAGAGALVWLLAFRTAAGASVDGHVLAGLIDAVPWGSRAERLVWWTAQLADPLPYALLSAVVLAVAVRRLGMARAAVVLAILIAANVATQQLKPLLAEPRHTPLVHADLQIGAASWPSGHSTAAMALALCAALVAPPRLRRPVAAVALGLAAAVGAAVVGLDWHNPSDALGGFAVAGATTALALAAWWTATARTAAARGPGSRAAPRSRWRRGTG
jgi:membrane-associated phospholipid phosphatase